MNASQINVLPIYCHLSNLIVVLNEDDQGITCAAIEQEQAFVLSVSVEFRGPGAIALLPLSPTLTVEFYARAVGPGEDVTLGISTTQAIAQTLTYTPTLEIESASSVGLQSGLVYRLGVLLRVGAPTWPGLISGFLEELSLEVYTTPTAAPIAKGDRPSSARKRAGSTDKNGQSKTAH
jgi:hypothetical protein